MAHPRSGRRPALPACAAWLAGVALGCLVAQPTLRPLTWGAGLAAGVAVLVATRGRPRSAAGRTLALLLLGACGAAAALEARSRVAARSWPPGSEAVETHLAGTLDRPAEPTFDGGRRLLLRTTAHPAAAPEAGGISVRLDVRPSPPEATAPLDRLASGARVRVWCRVYRPPLVGREGAGDPRLVLAARGLDALGTVKSARLVEPDGGAAGPRLRGLLDLARAHGRSALDLRLGRGTEGRALAGAMLLGDRAALAPWTERRLRAAGLVHLVAISGLHLGLIAVAVAFALERCRIPALPRAALLAFALKTFGTLVGWRPSVLRAALGASLLAAGRTVGRTGEAVNALGLVAATLAAVAPLSLLDPGLQLSFAATAGILLAAPRQDGGALLAGVRVAAAAHLATAPLTATHFGWLAPVGIVTNLVAIPLCALLLGAGYLAMAFRDLPLLGPASGISTRLAADGILHLADAAAEIGGWASYPVAGPSPGLVVGYYAVALAWVAGRRTAGRAGRCRALGAGFAVLVALVHVGPPPHAPPERSEAAVLDVGQAQAVLARGRGGGAVLVDAGGSAHPRFDPGERIVVPAVLRLHGRRIDTLVLSHDHLDHAGGASAVLRDLEVAELCLPPGFHRSPLLLGLAARARGRGTAVRLCQAGEGFERGGLAVAVLGPSRSDAHLDSNDRSVALILGRQPHRLLVPGDLQAAGERALLNSAIPLRAEALVVSHHGSASGTSTALLARARPRHAIASCGAGNRFGHPHPAVLERLRAARATPWRTDRDGTLLLSAAETGGWIVRPSRRGR